MSLPCDPMQPPAAVPAFPSRSKRAAPQSQGIVRQIHEGCNSCDPASAIMHAFVILRFSGGVRGAMCMQAQMEVTGLCLRWVVVGVH